MTRRWHRFPIALVAAFVTQTTEAQHPVEVGESVRRDVALSLELVGTVEPLLSSTISSEIPGRIEAILVEENDRVRRGQVLARLDPDMIEVRLRQAEARLLQAEAEYERVRKLVEQNLTSLEKLQQAQTSLALRKADHKLVQLSLDHTTIRALFVGRIAWRHTDIGEWISTGGRVLDLIHTDSVFVMTSVPEKHVRHLEPGTPAVIACDAYPHEDFEGRVHRVIPRGDPNSHAFPIKIKVPNPGGKLKAGMFAQVDLEIDRAEQLVLVPKDAVVNVAGERYVFEVNGALDRVRRVKVQVGRTEADQVAVDGDLTPGLPVVVTGNETLRDNDEVMITKHYSAR